MHRSKSWGISTFNVSVEEGESIKRYRGEGVAREAG